MQAFAAGFDASWRPPRVALNPNLTDDDVAWLNGQLELVETPTVRFAREIKPPPLPSGKVPRPASAELRLPTERIR